MAPPPQIGPGYRALVTGASSGIGAATARALAGRGVTVGLVGRRADRLSTVLEDCRAGSPQARMWVADLAEVPRAAAIAVEAWDAFGHLDLLVNNAAVPKRRHVTRLSDAEVEQTMRVNFLSPVAMTLAVLPRMVARGRGAVVNVGSVGGRLGIAGEAAYCASKFALTGWSEAMAVDLAGSGVTIRLIQPGPIDTEIWDRPGEDAPLYDGPKDPPETVAAGILDALGSDRFEHYLPDLKAVVTGKDADIDAYIAMAASLAGEAGQR